EDLDLPEGCSEQEALAELAAMLDKNVIAKPLIGLGYHGCHTPPVIQRNLFENPGWYTSYTPYQPEISQGRLELLFHFQTLVAELTGLPAANASLLDEATAVAEAVGMAYRHHRGKRHRVIVADGLHRQSLDVMKTRCDALGLQIRNGEPDSETVAVVMQYPDTLGGFEDPTALVEAAKAVGAVVIVATDPLSLCLIEPPGEWGADIVVGSAQRFGVPIGFGGPHAAYVATSEALTRSLPGRLVGLSVDAAGRPAYRLALQTREQHIRREKATSNICTAQALLANMAAAYAIWHGPDGLREIAQKVHGHAEVLSDSLKKAGYTIVNNEYFDTITFKAPGQAASLVTQARKAGFLLRKVDKDTVSVALDETVTADDLASLAAALGLATPSHSAGDRLPSKRNAERFLSQDVFHAYRSETEMMRFLRRLMDMDLALDKSMIPLGSCTMKLNAAAEMMPVSWPSVGAIHPFAPAVQSKGYAEMIDQLEVWLAEITGFDAVSLQPNAGSQGEYAGLLAIARYQKAQGERGRDICLIPTSAHGTNPASAQMAGMKVVPVGCDEDGNIDVADMKAKAEANRDRLAACMITYPSTHGVFETAVREICSIVHANGGQVYLDGANLNAMVGVAQPGEFGADVCHMNLHKTFCIPHGGGGPGVGP
ncbi:MAG: aminomethyl-transferring glycine dehydrogenase, partial [Pseudomonadota bacterium]